MSEPSRIQPHWTDDEPDMAPEHVDANGQPPVKARRAWGNGLPEVPGCPRCDQKGFVRPVELLPNGEPTARCATHARLEREISKALAEAARQPGWGAERAREVRAAVMVRFRR
jgi:hypothetical protein